MPTPIARILQSNDCEEVFKQMHARLTFAALLSTLLLPATTATANNPVTGAPRPAGDATRILDRKAAQRLLANKGLTLQWIEFETPKRGTARVSIEGKTWRLRGTQSAANGAGKLLLDGTITEIGVDYFTFAGRITITDTPDAGRACDKTKTWHFGITQKRPYYRLREFEWCDGLTDYIDVHF